MLLILQVIHLIFIAIRWSRSGSTTVAIEEEGEKEENEGLAS